MGSNLMRPARRAGALAVLAGLSALATPAALRGQDLDAERPEAAEVADPDGNPAEERPRGPTATEEPARLDALPASGPAADPAPARSGLPTIPRADRARARGIWPYLAADPDGTSTRDRREQDDRIVEEMPPLATPISQEPAPIVEPYPPTEAPTTTIPTDPGGVDPGHLPTGDLPTPGEPTGSAGPPAALEAPVGVAPESVGGSQAAPSSPTAPEPPITAVEAPAPASTGGHGGATWPPLGGSRSPAGVADQPAAAPLPGPTFPPEAAPTFPVGSDSSSSREPVGTRAVSEAPATSAGPAPGAPVVEHPPATPEPAPAAREMDTLGEVLVRSLTIESGLADPPRPDGPTDPPARFEDDDRRSDSTSDPDDDATDDATDPAAPRPGDAEASDLPTEPPAELEEVGEAAIQEAAGSDGSLDVPDLATPAPPGLLVDAGMLNNLAAQTVIAPDLSDFPPDPADAPSGVIGPSPQAAAVPEPSTLALFGAVVVVLVVRRRRR